MYDKWKQIAAVGAAAMMLTPGSLPVRAEEKKPLSVMCLGDSITDGFWLTGGYRNTLCTLITEHGFASEVDFVGPQWGITTADSYDPNHAGYSGYSIADIAQEDSISGARTGITGFAEWLMNEYPADVVFLQIGTNDILSLYDLEHFGERLETLVDIILAAIPENGQLYLATLPVMDATNNLYISDYFFTVESMDEAVSSCNEQIRALAKKKQDAGKPVTLAEINGVLTKADLYDGVHPSAEGYEKMGQFWYQRLTEYREKHSNPDVTTETSAAETTTSVTETTSTTTETTSQTAETTTETSKSATTSETTAETTVSTTTETTVSEPPADVPGDLNGDGVTDVKDAVLAARIIGMDVTAEEMPASGVAPADFNGSGQLDSDDLAALLQYIAGLITEQELRKTS